jgi:hypothetical protein
LEYVSFCVDYTQHVLSVCNPRHPHRFQASASPANGCVVDEDIRLSDWLAKEESESTDSHP